MDRITYNHPNERVFSTLAPTQLWLHISHLPPNPHPGYSLHLNLFISVASSYPEAGNYLGFRLRLFQRGVVYHCQHLELLVNYDNKQKTDIWFYYYFLSLLLFSFYAPWMTCMQSRSLLFSTPHSPHASTATSATSSLTCTLPSYCPYFPFLLHLHHNLSSLYHIRYYPHRNRLATL